MKRAPAGKKGVALSKRSQAAADAFDRLPENPTIEEIKEATVNVSLAELEERVADVRDSWETDSLLEDAIEELTDESGVYSGRPDTCTPEEACRLRRELREQGPAVFCQRTIDAGRYSAKKLLSAFGIRPPAFLEGQPDEAYFSLLRVAKAKKSRGRLADSSDDNSEYDVPSAGVMKPDITFFGEELPDEFSRRLTENDRDKVDLVIVIGTSLKVTPVSEIASFLPPHIPQIYISRQSVTHINFDIDLLGDCDVVVAELCRQLKWPLVHEMVPADQEITVKTEPGYPNRHVFTTNKPYVLENGDGAKVIEDAAKPVQNGKDGKQAKGGK
ncbi:DHS-like NAD/FAD-binding domain-containing protein, partial [Trichoderma longibrachiatum ATCC 18648]